MTYQNDPNRHRRSIEDNDTSYAGWIIGAIAAFAVVFGIFMLVNRNDNATTASNTNRPAASAPTTTGSGASSGTTPSNDGTIPQTNQSSTPRPATPDPATPAR